MLRPDLNKMATRDYAKADAWKKAEGKPTWNDLVTFIEDMFPADKRPMKVKTLLQRCKK